jgi:hypothetical protein
LFIGPSCASTKAVIKSQEKEKKAELKSVRNAEHIVAINKRHLQMWGAMKTNKKVGRNIYKTSGHRECGMMLYDAREHVTDASIRRIIRRAALPSLTLAKRGSSHPTFRANAGEFPGREVRFVLLFVCTRRRHLAEGPGEGIAP